MTTEIFRVIQCGDPETYTGANGQQGNVRQLMLQQMGTYQNPAEQAQRLPNALIVHTYGNLALCQFYPGDIVVAAIRFEAKAGKDGRWWQEVTAADIVKIR